MTQHCSKTKDTKLLTLVQSVAIYLLLNPDLFSHFVHTVCSILYSLLYYQAIYGRLFICVVDQINKVIYTQPEETEDVQQTIGLLDIFGFENFNKNRFGILLCHVSFERKNIIVD